MSREQTLNPVGKALWYIESHFASDLSLEDVAAQGGVSRFHMTRAFATATGWSVMRYTRGRRLTEAARALSNGASDILSVALDAGYNSHEAFTRAFRDQFGLTPDAVRAQRHLKNIDLVEAISMDQTILDKLDAPRYENAKAFFVAGIAERCSGETSAGIPAQWQRFQPYIGHIPGQVGNVAYGVVYNSDDEGNVDYLCGVEVSNFSNGSARIEPRGHTREPLRRVLASRSRLDDSTHVQHDLEQLVPRIRSRAGRRAVLRTVRRAFQSYDGYGRP